MATKWLTTWQIWYKIPGGRLNKKDGLTRYGNSHVKDKTAVRTKSPYVDKMVFILRRGPVVVVMYKQPFDGSNGPVVRIILAGLCMRSVFSWLDTGTHLRNMSFFWPLYIYAVTDMWLNHIHVNDDYHYKCTRVTQSSNLHEERMIKWSYHF